MTFKKLLFVCMGNSCSSPMAETIMQNLMVKTSLYWEVDSAALRGWNIGRRPHKQCLRVLREHGLRSDHFSRQLTIHDFYYFDYIIAMSDHVHKELLQWAAANHITNTPQAISLAAFGKRTKNDLTPASKLKAFRKAYFNIKECCKQLILGQQVSIVRYDMPSTEDDDEQEYQQHNSTPKDTIDSPNSISTHDYHRGSFLRSPCSVCSASRSHKKKLCQNCGQKFLAQL